MPEVTRLGPGFLLSGLHPASPLGPLSGYLPRRLPDRVSLPGFCAGPLAQACTLGLVDDPDGLFTCGSWLDVTDGQIHGEGPWVDGFSESVCTLPNTTPVDGLLAHQQQTVYRARSMQGFACFDDVGTGKTITAIAWAALTGLPTVVLCPASLVDQWQQKWSEYTSRKVVAITGTVGARRQLYDSDPPLMVVSYDVATSDASDLIRLCTDRAVIFDEAHRLRNPKAKRTRLALRIARVAARRLILTATPVDNDVSELYWLISGLVQPWLWGSWQRFSAQIGSDPDVEALSQMAAPFYTRHVLAAGHRHVPTVVNPDDRLREQYRQLSRQAPSTVRACLPAVTESRVSATTTALLRMAAVSPRLLHLSKSSSARKLRSLIDDVPGPKVDYAVKVVTQWALESNKSVVFCSYTALFDTLVDQLTAAGLSCVVYDGSMDALARARAVTEFEAVDGPMVLVASDAAAEGLNLGSRCNHSISLDVPYTPGRKGQRAGRVWRMDTASADAVHVDLVTAGTIEHGLAARVAHKATLLDRLLPPTGPAVSPIGSGGAVLPLVG